MPPKSSRPQSQYEQFVEDGEGIFVLSDRQDNGSMLDYLRYQAPRQPSAPRTFSPPTPPPAMLPPPALKAQFQVSRPSSASPAQPNIPRTFSPPPQTFSPPTRPPPVPPPPPLKAKFQASRSPVGQDNGSMFDYLRNQAAPRQQSEPRTFSPPTPPPPAPPLPPLKAQFQVSLLQIGRISFLWLHLRLVCH
ncbi:hypothetical protein ACEPPN_019460 [Leptodophora sp. 'Broadleaf-Isolate-01']